MKRLKLSPLLLFGLLVLCLNYALWANTRTYTKYDDPECGASQACNHLHTHSGGEIIPKINGSTNLFNNDLRDNHFQSLDLKNTVIFGDENRSRKRFLTIGIPSVWRSENYLTATIDSIMTGTTLTEKTDIFVYVLLADADPHLRLKRAKKLKRRYDKEIKNGLLKVLQPPTDLYPTIDYTTIRRTYNDSVDRVKWRVKQAQDFAFLFWYVWTQQPSTYYLVLEDDILSAKNFLSATKEFADLHQHYHWVALQLASFISIGQLLRCEDLKRLSSFILLFHREQPVDLLMNMWIVLMAPDESPEGRSTKRVPALFQHIGVQSTLANKTQFYQDETFGISERRFPDQVNPRAELFTTIKRYKNYQKEFPYSPGSGIFWGIPETGDTFDIVFPIPLNISRVVVITGTGDREMVNDQLQHGALEISSNFLRAESRDKASCEGFTSIQRFKKGEVDVKHLQQMFPTGIQCIRIMIGSKQRSWIIIREIVILEHETMMEGNEKKTYGEEGSR